MGADGTRSRIDIELERARRRLKRVTPQAAATELASGSALLIDTRTDAQRARDGVIPGALVVDRTVLEWRLDPTSPFRLDQVDGDDVRIILICNQGYSTSLAAASLLDLGLRNFTDVVGGFESWKDAGLPVEPPADSDLMSPPSSRASRSSLRRRE
jgi:rhodanese-related sulfurtransferase